MGHFVRQSVRRLLGAEEEELTEGIVLGRSFR